MCVCVCVCECVGINLLPPIVIVLCVEYCTCRELNMVKIHANTRVFLLTANSPNTHVSPIRGSRTTDAFTTALRTISEGHTSFENMCAL